MKWQIGTCVQGRVWRFKRIKAGSKLGWDLKTIKKEASPISKNRGADEDWLLSSRFM